MNAFAAFLQADWAERAGWTLLHSLWQIAAVAAVYAIAAFLLRNRSADCRYVVGCVAILAMLGLPVGTYVLQPHDLPSEIEEVSNTPAVAASPTESATPPSALTEPAIVSASPFLRSRTAILHPVEAVLAETTMTRTVTFEAAVAAQPATTDLFFEIAPLPSVDHRRLADGSPATLASAATGMVARSSSYAAWALAAIRCPAACRRAREAASPGESGRSVCPVGIG